MLLLQERNRSPVLRVNEAILNLHANEIQYHTQFLKHFSQNLYSLSKPIPRHAYFTSISVEDKAIMKKV